MFVFCVVFVSLSPSVSVLFEIQKTENDFYQCVRTKCLYIRTETHSKTTKQYFLTGRKHSHTDRNFWSTMTMTPNDKNKKRNKKRSKPPEEEKYHSVQSAWNGSNNFYDYDVDYNDHFETPLAAYQDILPVMMHVMVSSNNSTGNVARLSNPNHWTVYDPYYCNGRTSTLLQQHLGIGTVIHEKRDFYRDIQNKTLPEDYDIFLTNPPYSDDHKQKCLEFCIQNVWYTHRRPFFLLMPAYVAARQYYRKMISDGGGGTSVVEDDIMYVVPSTQYKYDHPEGTGYDLSPFDSLWFCCVGRDNVSSFKQKSLTSSASLSSLTSVESNRHTSSRIRIATSLHELATMGIIKLDNRPNPKQRRKKNKNRQQVISSSTTSTSTTSTSPTPAAILSSLPKSGTKQGNKTTLSDTASKPSTKSTKKRQNSKYRDEKGTRKKKRF